MQRKSSLYSLLFTVFNDAIGWGIALTIFAPLIMSKSDSLVSAAMAEGTRNILLGLLIGSYAATQFFSMPLIGALSDHFGRKKVLEWTLVGAALSFFLSAYAIWLQSLTLLFISRLLAGLFSGNSGTAQASIADMSTEKTKSKNLALCGIVGGISWIIGPPLGGFLSSPTWFHWFDYATPFWFLGFLFVANLIWLNKSYIETYQKREKHDWKQEIKDLTKLSKIPHMTSWLIVAFLFYFGWFFFVTYFPTVLVLKYHFSQEGIGYMSGYLSIFFLLTSLALNKGLAERIRSETLTLCTLFLIGALMLITNSVDWRIWFFTFPFLAIGSSACWVAVMAIPSNLAGTANQGKIFGISQSICSLALFFAPLITGLLASYDIALPMLLGGVVLLGAGFYTWTLQRKRIKDR
jgi:DHA1 family tetracycline resistance protein-like MFS transporter